MLQYMRGDRLQLCGHMAVAYNLLSNNIIS
jgi:hypothetical protein